MQQLEAVQHQILTGILELPRTTPYKALLMELGCWTMEARVSYRKLMLYHDIQRSDDKRVVKRLIEIQSNKPILHHKLAKGRFGLLSIVY